MAVEPVEIPVLSHEQQMLILRAANRSKRDSLTKRALHYVHIAFSEGKMFLSESEKMKVAE